jgi:hypothetical protein
MGIRANHPIRTAKSNSSRVRYSSLMPSFRPSPTAPPPNASLRRGDRFLWDMPERQDEDYVVARVPDLYPPSRPVADVVAQRARHHPGCRRGFTAGIRWDWQIGPIPVEERCFATRDVKAVSCY